MILAEAPPPTWAGIITAFAGVVTALALLAGALPALIKVMRKQDATDVAIGKVHTIVNQQRTDQMNYNAALIRALENAGVKVPVDQSKPELP